MVAAGRCPTGASFPAFFSLLHARQNMSSNPTCRLPFYLQLVGGAPKGAGMQKRRLARARRHAASWGGAQVRPLACWRCGRTCEPHALPPYFGSAGQTAAQPLVQLAAWQRTAQGQGAPVLGPAGSSAASATGPGQQVEVSTQQLVSCLAQLDGIPEAKAYISYNARAEVGKAPVGLCCLAGTIIFGRIP